MISVTDLTTQSTKVTVQNKKKNIKVLKKKIILSRPAVEAGESLGFLPGDLKEKLDPYLQPLYDALKDMIRGDRLENLAYRYYGDSTLWWIIAKANGIRDGSFGLKPDEKLRIPGSVPQIVSDLRAINEDV